MIYAPHMLMIGSAGRDSGKTVLACELIRRFAVRAPLVAVKATVVSGSRGACPRGGRGCGACESLAGDYAVSDDAGAPPRKDTARMAAAGASRTLWLRVRRNALDAGAKALLQAAEPASLIVCESNSLRTTIEPGLFVMVRPNASRRPKPSAAKVARLADLPLTFDGRGFTPGIGEIGISQGRWILRENATAVVLAGGHSSRMGRDKALLDIGGKPLISLICDALRPNFKELIVSCADPARYAFVDAIFARDRAADRGPLMGLLCSLDASSSDLNFVVACDMPAIRLYPARRLLRELRNADAAIPCHPAGLEPLYAVYRRSLRRKVAALLGKGKGDVRSLYATCRTRYVDFSDPTPFRNLNTPEDFDEYLSSFRTSV
jgi:molybdopterin-guanine dinucleotide biosynthesis protein A